MVRGRSHALAWGWLLGVGRYALTLKSVPLRSYDGRAKWPEETDGGRVPINCQLSLANGNESVKETIRARVERDPRFRKELLREGIESLLPGDIDTAKTILRDYINATVGVVRLAEGHEHSIKEPNAHARPAGNPRAHNHFEIVSFLQQWKGVRFRLMELPK
jgi:hypothetical protein